MSLEKAIIHKKEHRTLLIHGKFGHHLRATWKPHNLKCPSDRQISTLRLLEKLDNDLYEALYPNLENELSNGDYG